MRNNFKPNLYTTVLHNIEYFYQSVSAGNFINTGYIEGKNIVCDSLLMRKNGERRQRMCKQLFSTSINTVYSYVCYHWFQCAKKVGRVNIQWGELGNELYG